MSLTDTISLPLNVSVLPIAMHASVLAFIQRMSSCITASVVKTMLSGLRRLVIKAILFENSLCLCSRQDERQSHCQQRFMSIVLSPRNVTRMLAHAESSYRKVVGKL